eukprot:CAMPEP_0113489472 /NCGR_PEP_ID=MMETSP0014_2-20120614/26547_1 /TAXON_ID=2857 /ORGANISM="Nitzschia sp." /LENGTH=159 /DNA_ID=CAMNT_0000383211 /DNA_START=204 /DNA_END=685 /DNA_ORIENTATION=+ /assembly_acc=CAM_ASM_000159
MEVKVSRIARQIVRVVLYPDFFVFEMDDPASRRHTVCIFPIVRPCNYLLSQSFVSFQSKTTSLEAGNVATFIMERKVSRIARQIVRVVLYPDFFVFEMDDPAAVATRYASSQSYVADIETTYDDDDDVSVEDEVDDDLDGKDSSSVHSFANAARTENLV